MRVSEIMTKDVQCMESSATVREIASKMKELDTGAIPICQNDRLVGMVTDRDIVLKTLADGADPGSAKASDIMTGPIVYCLEDQDVEDAARIMEEMQIRRLPVLSDEKRLVGILSLGDVATRGTSEALSGEVLKKVSEPDPSVAA